MPTDTKTAELALAKRVRAACVKAALAGYERAQLDGLCHEGAWECAIEAMRALDLEEIIDRAETQHLASL